MFRIVKRYYDRGVYTAENVAAFVASGALTADEYQQITGLVYSA